MRQANARFTKRGRGARRLHPKWSDIRSPFITARSSFRCTSQRIWSATNSESFLQHVSSRDTAPAVRRTRLSDRPDRRQRRLRLPQSHRGGRLISKASGRFIRMSPQKARLVVDMIRGKNVNEALMTLKFTNKGATGEIEKVVRSAVANASQKSENVDVDNLFVETAFINEGPRQKRIRPAPMGRAYRYQRRSSHITIELGERE